MVGGVQTIIERTSLVWKVRSKHISGDIDELYVALTGDQCALTNIRIIKKD